MAVPVLMPRQGQSVESCILGQWYKSVGEEVSEGDILFSYETDKASFEEEAKESGILLAAFFEEGDEIPVLTNVAVIGKEGESVEEFRPGNAAAEEKPEETKEVDESPKVFEFDVEESSDKRIRISPLAKNMAEKLGVVIQSLKGSGPRGRIIARDVEEASKSAKGQKHMFNPEQTKPEPAKTAPAKPAVVLESGVDFEVKSIPNIRKLIATAMHQSLQNSAQLTHHLSADARQILKIAKEIQKRICRRNSKTKCNH